MLLLKKDASICEYRANSLASEMNIDSFKCVAQIGAARYVAGQSQNTKVRCHNAQIGGGLFNRGFMQID